MESFNSTFQNILNQEKIHNKEVALMIAPPLSKDRFDKEKRFPSLKDRLKGIIRDFIPAILPAINNWDQYLNIVVAPILIDLQKLRLKTESNIVADVTYQDFKKIFSSNKYKVVFLVAHHIPARKNKRKEKNNGWIEFANGGIPNEIVFEDLKNHQANSKISMIFMVCNLQKLTKLHFREIHSFHSVSAASWELPFKTSMKFAAEWILQMNGEQSLAEAYDQAIIDFFA